MPVVPIYASPSFQDHNIGVKNYGTEESVMNRIADALVPKLVRCGFPVFRNNPNMDLAGVVKDSNAKIGANGIHFAMHSDAGPSTAKGMTVFYCEGSERGKQLAQIIYDMMNPLTPANPDRGIKSTNEFAEVVKTDSLAVLIEIGFHTNEIDSSWILANIDNIATVYAKALCKFCGITYVETPAPSVITIDPNEYDRLKKLVATYESKVNSIKNIINQ